MSQPPAVRHFSLPGAPALLQRLAAAANRLSSILWICFLIALPVTSFPFFPSGFGGDALVRPLSLFPLLALLALVTIPRLLRGPLPRTFLTLLPFVVIAIASSINALLQGIDSLLGVSVAERITRALITLGVGGAIYITVALWPRDEEDLRLSLRWIYAGFALALAWGTVQAVYVLYFNPTYFHWVNNLQHFVSMRSLLVNRVSGMTYEPNWFAVQIDFLLLPWLLASLFTGYSAFRRRIRWRGVAAKMKLVGAMTRWAGTGPATTKMVEEGIPLEGPLFVWAIGIQALTFSRAGLGLMVVLVLSGLMFFRNGKASHRQTSLVDKGSNLPTPTLQPEKSKRWLRRLLEAGIALAVIAGLLFAAGANNPFFARLWDYWSTGKRTSLSGYLEYLGFGARFTYGTTAFYIFDEQPLLGVGLGNYAFYFEDNLPDRLLAETPEILHILTQNANRYRLITPKNLYLRILAETGVLGLATFLAFVIAIFGSALALRIWPHPAARCLGTGGLFALLAFTFLAFSFDSFAIPNMWIAFGLVTAALRIFVIKAPGTLMSTDIQPEIQ